MPRTDLPKTHGKSWRPGIGTTACAFALLLAAVELLRSEPSAGGAPARRDACRYGPWSEPQWLEQPHPLPSATRFAGVASMDATPAAPAGAGRTPAGYAAGVAGSPPLEEVGRSSVQWPPHLRTFRLDGTVTGGPEGDFWFAYPRAATDRAGDLHVVWAEPDEKLPTRRPVVRGTMPVLRSLWRSTLHGSTWSRPQRIYRATRLGWDEVNASRLVPDDRGGLHLAFVADDAADGGIVYLRANGAATEWRATKVVQLPVVYLDLAVDRDGRPAIAFVGGGGPVSQPRANVLFLTRSADGGNSWTRPVEVSRPDEDPAFEPHVFFDRDAAVRLEWVQQSLGGFTGGRILHTILADTGRRATSAIALPSSVMTSRSQAAIDACGSIHLMTQWYDNDVVELRYTRLTSGGWTSWSRPFDGPGAHASLAADASRVHVVWSVTPESRGDSTIRTALAHATLPFSGPQ